MGIEIIILNLLGLIFFIVWMVRTIKDFKKRDTSTSFFSLTRILKGTSFLLILGGPLLVGNFLFVESGYAVLRDDGFYALMGVLLSFLISAVWFYYVRKLDIFEKEKWWHLFLVFVFSCISTLVVGMIGYGVVSSLGFPEAGSNHVIYDFLYCVVVIGGVEETAKLVPVLAILLLFRDAINSPYDFILYGSVSALGFAFVENSGYIYESQLQNIGGRALYASVAHMTFTSTACYGIMLVRFKFNKISPFLIIPLFFGLAMLAHGFYDFWVINEYVVSFSSLTVIFFLITVHIWTTMKNNALNVSNFFMPDVEVENDKLRYFLILSLSGLLMLGYLLVGFVHGREASTLYLWQGVFSYGYLIFYLGFGLSRYHVLQDRKNPLKLPFKFLFPLPLDPTKPPPPPPPPSVDPE